MFALVEVFNKVFYLRGVVEGLDACNLVIAQLAVLGGPKMKCIPLLYVGM